MKSAITFVLLVCGLASAQAGEIECLKTFGNTIEIRSSTYRGGSMPGLWMYLGWDSGLSTVTVPGLGKIRNVTVAPVCSDGPGRAFQYVNGEKSVAVTSESFKVALVPELKDGSKGKAFYVPLDGDKFNVPAATGDVREYSMRLEIDAGAESQVECRPGETRIGMAVNGHVPGMQVGIEFCQDSTTGKRVEKH